MSENELQQLEKKRDKLLHKIGRLYDELNDINCEIGEITYDGDYEEEDEY